MKANTILFLLLLAAFLLLLWSFRSALKKQKRYIGELLPASILGKVAVGVYHHGLELLAAFREYAKNSIEMGPFERVLAQYVWHSILRAKEWKHCVALVTELDIFVGDTEEEDSSEEEKKLRMHMVRNALFFVHARINKLYEDKILFYSIQNYLTDEARQEYYQIMEGDAKLFKDYGLPFLFPVSKVLENNKVVPV